MANHDPISDMLTRIRNASEKKHQNTKVPASRMARSIAKVLQQEGFIAEIKIGQAVEVYIDAFRGHRFTGRIDSIGRATASTFSLLPSQGGGGNYTKVIQVVPIKIVVMDPGDARLMIGMNASIKIHLAH